MRNFLTARGRAAEPSAIDVDTEAAPGRTGAVGNEQIAATERLAELQRRLVALAQVFFEDYSQTISEESLSGFACLMRYHSSIGMPLISAESTGLVTATWRKDNECLSMRFADRHHLDFAVTYVAEESIQRRWGKANLASWTENVPHGKRIAAGW